MKKLMAILAAFMFAAVVFTSCGSPEADAKKMIKCSCEYFELYGKAIESGEEADMEAADAQEVKCNKLAGEMDEKYKDEDSDDAKAYNKAGEDFNPDDCK